MKLGQLLFIEVELSVYSFLVAKLRREKKEEILKLKNLKLIISFSDLTRKYHPL